MSFRIWERRISVASPAHDHAIFVANIVLIPDLDTFEVRDLATSAPASSTGVEIKFA